MLRQLGADVLVLQQAEGTPVCPLRTHRAAHVQGQNVERWAVMLL
jgi:hypothetical protein